MSSSTFESDFSHFLTLSNICSFYLPQNIERKWVIYSFKFYCFILTIGAAIVGGDLMAQTICLNMPLIPKLVVIFASYCYNWNVTRKVYYWCNIKYVKEIFDHYCNMLYPDLWPDQFQDKVKLIYKGVLRTEYLSIFAVVGPMFFALILKLFWTRTPYFPTLLANSSFYGSQSSILLLLFQGCVVCSLNASWAAEEAFIYLLLRIMIAKYEYLSDTLRKIISEIKINNNLKVDDSACEEDSIRLARGRLIYWIKEHNKVIKTLNLFKKYFCPLIYGEFMYITIAGCGLLFVSLSGEMPFDIIVLSLLYVASRMFMIHRLCRCCDKISQMSANFIFDGLSGDCLTYPKDITKTLLIISESVQRPVEITVKRILPLDCRSFLNVLYLQYRFFTFMQNIQSRNSKTMK